MPIVLGHSLPVLQLLQYTCHAYHTDVLVMYKYYMLSSTHKCKRCKIPIAISQRIKSGAHLHVCMYVILCYYYDVMCSHQNHVPRWKYKAHNYVIVLWTRCYYASVLHDGHKPNRSGFFIKANLPVNILVFYGKLVF